MQYDPKDMDDRMSEFNTNNFIQEMNYQQQFIDIIESETRDPIESFCLNYDCEQITGCLDHTQFGTALGDNFLDGFNLSSTFNGLPLLDGDMMCEEEENDMEEESSGTATTPTKRKGDRSRTLITERRRRGRMKEKLYALRALVPNITKMDKASIVGDAVLYIQELQIQAKKLRAEILGLELNQNDRPDNHTQLTSINHNVICKRIMQIGMFQVEERGFYIRVESNRGQGVAVSLYKALESLARFDVLNSNLTTGEEKFILTFTLKVQESEPKISLENLKLWVTGAFLSQGFEFQTQQIT